LRATYEKQGPVHRIVVEMDSGFSYFGSSQSRQDLVVGEAERFAKELAEAIKAAKQASKPPVKAFWNI